MLLLLIMDWMVFGGHHVCLVWGLWCRYGRSRMDAITICCIVIFNESLVRCHVLNLYTVTLYCYLNKSSPSPTASCCFPVTTSHETFPVLPSITYRHHNLFLRHTQTLHSPSTTKTSNDRQSHQCNHTILPPPQIRRWTVDPSTYVRMTSQGSNFMCFRFFEMWRLLL